MRAIRLLSLPLLIMIQSGCGYNSIQSKDEAVTAAKGAVKNIPAFGDSEMTFAAFEILRVAENEKPLTEVLERNLMTLPVSHRMALLMDLARFIGPEGAVKKRKQPTRKASASVM